VQIRGREWDERGTKMNADILVKISRDNIPSGRDFQDAEMDE
jgi:hypothetical protein